MATTRQCSLRGLFIILTVMAFTDSCPIYPGCKTNFDCTSITCSHKFIQKDVTTTLKLNTCKNPISLTVKLNVADLGISWSHTFKGAEDIGVPGFSYNIVLASGGVYVRAEVKRGDDQVVKMSVKLIVKLKIFGAGGKIGPAITIAEGSLGRVGVSLSDCGPIAWLKSQEIGVQIGVVVGLLVGVALITGCFCCCCCCCRCCRKRSQPGQAVTVPPAVVTMAPMGVAPVKYERFDMDG